MSEDSQLLTYLRRFRKILLIGPYPPPLGGVTVHIYRLHQALENSQVFNTLAEAKFKGAKQLQLMALLLKKEISAVHIHDTNEKLLLLLLLLQPLCGFEIILTLHNNRLLDTIDGFKKSFFRKALRRLSMLVLVSAQTLDQLRSNGIRLPANTIVEPAFLPPPLAEESSIRASYPESLSAFLQQKRPILLANAFQLEFYRDRDLYGLDLCIELTALLKRDFNELGFVFALANENINVDYLNTMKSRVSELGIEENFYFFVGQKELWPLFRQANLMIRPTSSDGDAVSIREALYFDLPVIASNVCPRPDKTVLFSYPDLQSLYETSRKVLHENTSLSQG